MATQMSKARRVRVFVACLMGLAVISCCCSVDSRTKRKFVPWRISRLTERLVQNPNDSKALNQLIELTGSEYRFEASRATHAFGDIGPAAVPALPRLSALLESSDPFISRAAAESLADLGPHSAPAIGPLLRRVENGDPTVDSTWFCAEAIGNIGKPAITALPILRSRIGAGSVQFDDSLRIAILKLEEEAKSNQRRPDDQHDE